MLSQHMQEYFDKKKSLLHTEKRVSTDDQKQPCDPFTNSLHYSNHRELWDNLSRNFELNRTLLDRYRSNKCPQARVSLSNVMEYLQDRLFKTFIPGLNAMLEKAVEEDSCYTLKTAFDGLDFLCEYLYNNNPEFPERKRNPVPLFEMEWVKNILKKSPRPFYPMHRLWSREYAATVIQAGMRGYWLRRRLDVEEMRQFWKGLEGSFIMTVTSEVQTGLEKY